MAFENIYMYAPDGRKTLVGSAVEREQLRVKGYSETAPKLPAVEAKLSPSAQEFVREASAVKPAAVKAAPKAEPASDTKTTSK